MDSLTLCNLLGGEHFGRKKEVNSFGDILSLQDNGTGTLFWIKEKYISRIDWIEFDGIVISDCKIPMNVTYILVENSRIGFSKALAYLFPRVNKDYNSLNVYLGESVSLGENLFLGQNVVIESGCIIGDNVFIGHNSVICQNSVIGSNVRIGSLTNVGGSGFGFERDELGQYVEILQNGKVIIEHYVNIGDGCTIDRAAIGVTKICENVKIDNQVHIAHNCLIGKNTVVTAGVVLAGGVVIGDNCWLGPKSTINNGVHFPSNSILGIGSVLLKSKKVQGTYFGMPAIKI